MRDALAHKEARPDAPPSTGRARITLTRDGRTRIIFAAAYGVAVTVAAIGVWLVAAAPGVGSEVGGVGPASRAVLFVLVANLVLILALAGVVGLRVADLFRQRVDAGARLHLRFVTLFSAVAVVPAILVALVFGVLVNRGVDGWFSANVRSAVENGASIARAYYDGEVSYVASESQAMVQDLANVREYFPQRVTFGRALTDLAANRGFSALYVIDGDGRVLARGEVDPAVTYLAPPPATLANAAAGEVVITVPEQTDLIAVVTALPAYGDALLYGLRAMRPGMMAQLREAEQAIVAYRDAQASRARLQAAFLLSYAETALLVLVGAVWLGMFAANSISAPVGRLVQAAHRVAAGDLDARVDSKSDPAEIAVLSHAFNRMTEDLQRQQQALRAASAEAQARRRFIETVLSGVSAGVIGLDAKGRVSAINAQALRLLELEEGAALGRPIARVAPELKPLTGRAGAEAEVDVTRGAETRRLRVRVSGGSEGEQVLTFDDITRLVAAQRNAAWKDVARRIAHEIKNPLTPIQLSAERLRRKYRPMVAQDLETFDRCTETIIRQVGDIGRMVDEFSAFARMPTPKFAREDAAELLRQAVFAQRVAAPDTPVDLGEPLPEATLTCDGRMVGQALTNVLKNGAEAVAARRMTEPEARGRLKASMLLDDEHLTFVIEDDGVGLPAKDRDRLVEPYVTNREKGTGLGLAIVKRILEDHGGELVLADAVELSGARICLKFPRTARQAPGEAATAAT